MVLQAVVIVSVLLTGWSRLIVSAYGLEVLALLIIGLHLYSGVAATKAERIESRRVTQQVVLPIIFLVLSLAAIVTLFTRKDDMLGINLYYIPSASMMPTLMPGDIILVDTWVYRSAIIPSNGEIVTFISPHQPGTIMVKRIIQSSNNGDSYFLEGDNKNSSLDSRNFGEIPKILIDGKVLRTIRLKTHH